MPQVEQIVEYSAKDISDLISADAKRLADAKLKEGGVQGNQIEFKYEEKDGKSVLAGAAVKFKR